ASRMMFPVGLLVKWPVLKTYGEPTTMADAARLVPHISTCCHGRRHRTAACIPSKTIPAASTTRAPSGRVRYARPPNTPHKENRHAEPNRKPWTASNTAVDKNRRKVASESASDRIREEAGRNWYGAAPQQPVRR